MRIGPLLILFTVLLIGVLVIVVFHRSTRKTIEESNRGSTTRETFTPDGTTTTITVESSDRLASSSDEVLSKAAMRRIDSALAKLKGASDASEARHILIDLRAYLTSLPPETACAVIIDFLSDPARDAATRIGFSVGKAGFLDGHPSLRIGLLDWLGQISPIQAGAVAEKILAIPTHPDEWAVCLRNYARAHPGSESHEFLRSKAEELILNPVWRENPSIGFLEAFDVLVHTGSTESTSFLGEIVTDQTPKGKALGHAAYLTLDRLTIREPVAMMQQLAAQTDLVKVRGPMVANMFARADLRDPAQRQLVHDYLLDPSRTPGELGSFSGIYPNANFALSKNLLTETRTPTGEELAVHDAAALRIVETWLTDPAFAPVKPYLTTMRNRLTTFVNQASR